MEIEKIRGRGTVSLHSEFPLPFLFMKNASRVYLIFVTFLGCIETRRMALGIGGKGEEREESSPLYIKP